MRTTSSISHANPRRERGRAPRAARRGFTLVELLVVITLLAILMAMAAGVFFRVQAGQRARGNEATLNKLHSNLEIRWKAVLSNARDTLPGDLVTALGDKDRALVAWTYAKLKNEFPQGRSELVNIALPGTSTVLKPRAVFTSVGAASPDEESGMLLYAALTQSTVGGTVTGTEGLQQQVETGAGGSPYFKDGYGTPIVLIRHASSAEISNSPAYTKANVIKYGGTPVSVFTILDPNGKLILSAPAVGSGTAVPNSWATANAATRAAILAQLNQGLTLFPVTLDNVNVVPTLVSAGGNKVFVGSTGTYLGGSDESDDNVLSYRLRREGAKGD